ncbi:MAG: RNA polymerase sigma factor [Caldisericia bacterium]|jgi:RNA polymerase sigma-70 factor (ECF subfamily)|nr:RNA polymerase sigma factor [Caldisericia bacterium]
MIDKELVRRVKKGEISAFAELVEKYESDVFTYCLYILKDREDAKDLTQETFLKAFLNIKSLRKEEDFKFWLLRIARNSCFKKLRKRKMEKKLDLYEEEKEIKIDEEIIKDEKREKLIKAINKLDKKDREILTLRDIEGYSYEEISKILKISLNLTKVRIHRARKNLKKILGELKP